MAEFVRSWGAKWASNTQDILTAPVGVGAVPDRAWRVATFQRVHDALPASLRNIGADLSRIPEPPVLDDQGKVIRPGKAPAKARPADAPAAAGGGR